jgi:poly-gamma-glutamate synthesis protein (capsule biosynthesis protein)
MAKTQQLVRPALLAVRRLCVPVLGLFLLSGCTRAEEPLTFGIPLGSAELHTIFQGLYEAMQLPPRDKTPPAPVVIVPHHLTAAVAIAAGIQSLQAEKPSSVLLLSPDHFNACPSALCTGNIRFQSTFGTTEPDASVLTVLRSSPFVSERSAMFQREHGIHAVIPFISHLSSGTQVTPLAIAIRPDWKAQRKELLELIRRVVDQDVTLVISSDFSHYLPLTEADAADERTAKALFSRDFDGIARLENPAQSDCPPCLWLAAHIAHERNAYNPSVLLHTNSARLLHEETVPSTTSHFAIAFYQNTPLTSQDTAFAGDVTLTRAMSGSPLSPPKGIQVFWEGAGPRIVNLEGPLQELCLPNANAYIFCNPLSLWRKLKPLATHWGIENNHKLDQGERGYGHIRELLEKEGEVSLSEEGAVINGMRVFALTNLMNPVPADEKADLARQYQRVIRAIHTGSSSTLPQVVYVHTGTEYRALPSETEQKYLRSFVDHGAKAVIAVHSHVPSGMEIYRGAPMFHGLGNFMFDQLEHVETSTAKVVRLRPETTGVSFESITAR